MANFNITTANSLTTGTPLADQFTLTTALQVTVLGGAGNDQFFGLGTQYSTANIQGGQGNDTISLSAAGSLLTAANIAAGAGNDLIILEGAIGSAATILGGGGDDVIQFSAGSFNRGQINGNAGNDRITASATNFTGALLGLGAGVDTISLNGGDVSASTINGGGGNDLLIFSSITFSGSRIEGDTLGDSQFFGDDTIRFLGVGTLSGTTVNGGQGNDLIVVDQVISTGARIEGNQGNDSIFINSTVASGANFVGGGAGNDTITVSAALVGVFGTIEGGGGADVIDVSAAGATGGFIIGGAAADTINLGVIASGAALSNVGSGVNVTYAAFSQSNFEAFDSISAREPAGGGTGAFMVFQTAVDFVATQVGVVGAGSTRFTVQTGARVISTTFDVGRQSLTARAEALDAHLVQGQSVIFADGGGQNYLFVQGGIAQSGLANDMVIELDRMNFAAASGVGLARVNADQLKVVFN